MKNAFWSGVIISIWLLNSVSVAAQDNIGLENFGPKIEAPGDPPISCTNTSAGSKHQIKASDLEAEEQAEDALNRFLEIQTQRQLEEELRSKHQIEASNLGVEEQAEDALNKFFEIQKQRQLEEELN